MHRVVALTGATGFLGSVIAQHFFHAGWHVRSLVRSSSDTSRLSEISTELILGSLHDHDSLQCLTQGVEAIVHCAGITRGTTHADFGPVNIDSITHILHAIQAQPRAPRFLLISSLAAREPDLSPYAASKRAGERVLMNAEPPFPWGIFRPPAVYGPGDQELLPLFQWMARGLALLLGPPEARFSLLYVHDLARAVLKWVEQPRSPSKIYELHDGQVGGYTWQDITQTMAHVRKGHIIQLRIPRIVLTSLAMMNQRIARITGTPAMLTTGKVQELTHINWVCDNTAFTEATGWTPLVSLKEGLQQTLAL
ncbi:MAG: NAD-dependent epimerase/dehydratase family protein [Nitrospirales bacterium]|nr:NAD-dependent epimerase/dehydratase family protein [Nitrospirales bacterium]